MLKFGRHVVIAFTLRFGSLRGDTYETQSAIEEGSQFGGSIVLGSNVATVSIRSATAPTSGLYVDLQDFAGARTRSYVPSSSRPRSEEPSIDSDFASFSAMLSGVRCGA